MSNATWLSEATSSCNLHVFGPASCDGSFDFTLLFEQTILSIVPSIIFLFCLPISLIKLYRAAPRFNASTIRNSKLTIAILLTITQVSLLVLWVIHPASETPATLPALCLGLIVSLAIVFLSPISHTQSVRPSSLLGVYLLFSSVFDATQVRTLFLGHSGKVIPSLMCLSIALKLSLLICESWNKRSWLSPADQTLPPESTISILSRSLLWWLNPLFVNGMRTLLNQDQLYAIDPELRSRRTGRKLEAAFNKELDNIQDRAKLSAPPLSARVLPRACFRSVWTDVTAMIPMRLALVGFTFAQPFLFTRAIDYLSQQNHDATDNIGYGLIAATFIIYTGIAISTALYQQQISRIMTKLRGALISMIYDHILVVADGATKDGAALTLISSDTDTIIRVLGELNESWARLIEVAVGIGLLARQVGAVSIVLIVLTVISTQAQGWVSKRIGSRRKNWSAATQKRVSTTSAVFGSLQAVKMSGLMRSVSSLLHSLRVNELQMFACFARFIIGLNAIAVIPSIWAPVTTFIVYAIRARVDGSNGLNIAQAFTSLALLDLVTTPSAKLLTIMPLWAQALGCFERLQHYLELPPRVDRRSSSGRRPSSATNNEILEIAIEMSPLPPQKRGGVSVVVCSGMEVSLSNEGPAILKNVSLEANKRTVTVITGSTGRGKTTLLKTILGETHLLSGSIMVSSKSIAYCSQKPWITNTTIREFVAGLDRTPTEVDESWYDTVIYACDLAKDVASMPDGDGTQLGSRGVSLSGGQKARLALARAVYARRDIMLLDDVLSALDNNTEVAIIHRLLGPKGLLRKSDTTVLLVSHSSRVMAVADQIVAISESGCVVHRGSSSPSRIGLGVTTDTPLDKSADVRRATEVNEARVPKGPSKESKDDLARRTGDWSIYKYYFSNFHKRYLAMFVAFSVGAAFSSRFSQIWLNWWTADNDSDLGLYLTVYVILALAQTCFSNLNMWVVFLKMIPDSAINMHRTLLYTVAGAASSVYYQSDSGSILNRFAQDMALVVGALPTSLIATGNTLCETIASLAVISTGASYMGITIPVVMFAIHAIQKVYLSTSRQLRLLEIEARSPIYSHFLETLDGVVTIRAFGWEEEAKKQHSRLLDTAQSPYYLLSCIQRWLKLVLDLIVAALAVLVVGLAVSQRGTTSAGLLGVALTNILGFSQSLARLVTEWTTLETSLGAVARVRSFATTTEQEDSSGISTSSQNLVTGGEVVFSGVYAKYTDAPGPYDLHNIIFSILPGARVAICGRTGSGKSSFMLALLRLLPLRHGNIAIDGTDIKDVHPDVVRRNITAIPQQPFLLPGTLRSVLDPDAELSDTDLTSALSKVHLLSLVNEHGGLNADIDQQSLSQGQAQLLCLARALLRKTKLVILDEATSSLDVDTDALIRNVLRLEFVDCTVISIAHRATIILDADMVIMMDAGRVSAVGKPDELSIYNDRFRQLCGIP